MSSPRHAADELLSSCPCRSCLNRFTRLQGGGHQTNEEHATLGPRRVQHDVWLARASCGTVRCDRCARIDSGMYMIRISAPVFQGLDAWSLHEPGTCGRA